MKPDVWFIVKIYVVLLLNTRCESQEVGQTCILQSTEEEGICKLANECPLAEQQAKKGVVPTICGFFQLTTPIVCCKSKNLPQPNDNSFLSEEIIPVEPKTQIHTNKFSRISEEKCQEYSKNISAVVQVTSLITTGEPISVNVTKCWGNSSPLIVGGTAASNGEFRFMALIGYIPDDKKVEWKCGGTLISEKWVVTAAHCTFSSDAGEPKIIRLGELDWTRTDDSEHADYHIDKIISHPNYSFSEKYDDIALLSTKKEVTFTRFISPACLYTKSTFEQNVVIATGWGQTDFAGLQSEKLLKVSLEIYPNRQCERVFKNAKSELPLGIIKTMLCVGYLPGGKDTCAGDSGGPVVITDKQNSCKFYLVGITSFGKGCASVNTPAVYTKVSEYVNWIEKVVW